MSRAAEARAMKNAYRAGNINDDPYTNAVAEYNRNAKEEEMVTHGSKVNFNIESMLWKNIVECEYFRLNVLPLPDFTRVLNEIAEHVTSLLEYPDAPQVRALGFLYLRYTCPPKDLWHWVAPWMRDSELFAPTPDRGDRITMGEYVLSLLTQPQYHGSLLPRIPLTTKRNMMLKMTMSEDDERRAKFNRPSEEHFIPKTKVHARFEDDDTWYKATITAVPEAAAAAAAATRSMGGAVTVSEGGKPMWTVEFDEYGNEQECTLGMMQLRGDGLPVFSVQVEDGVTAKQLLGDSVDAHLEADRNAAVASGRDYGRKVGSLKSALAMKMESYSASSTGGGGRRVEPHAGSGYGRGRHHDDRGRSVYDFQRTGGGGGGYDRRDQRGYGGHSQGGYDRREQGGGGRCDREAHGRHSQGGYDRHGQGGHDRHDQRGIGGQRPRSRSRSPPRVHVAQPSHAPSAAGGAGGASAAAAAAAAAASAAKLAALTSRYGGGAEQPRGGGGGYSNAYRTDEVYDNGYGGRLGR